MRSRRRFMKYACLLSGALALAQRVGAEARENAEITLAMPDEGEQHSRTWMAFVASDYIWSAQQIPEVKRNLALIARTIAKYEPVSMLVSPDDYAEAVALLGGLTTHPFPITLVEFATDDLWLRDTGPVFVRSSDGQKYAVDFNFNGWGNKQEHQQDAQVARVIARHSGVVREATELVLEGGCFEVDGHGTAIMTKSCILNPNRNPHLTQHEVETELKALLGLRKIIWLDGVKGADITDGHTDFYARFIRPGSVVVSRENYREIADYQVTRDNIRRLRNSTDADGNPLPVTVIDNPDEMNEHWGLEDFAAGYIGYYVCNNAVIMQSFGDPVADRNARETLARAYPGRTIEQIRIDGIASGGGSIHCATQQEIAL